MVPDWRLPPGVPRGVWDYAESRSVADDYDAYHAGNPLFEFEGRFLAEELGEPPADGSGVIADLGCGSGRTLLPLVERGWSGLAIDLSQPMLDVVARKARERGLRVECVRANLVEVTPDVVPDAAATHALCLFSTLGMIRGREHRVAALRHMARVLRPGGRLVLHVHNFWFNLRDPGGPWWALRSRVAPRAADGGEIGDKVFPYRGVPNFFLHVFRAGELRRDLADAGLRVRRWAPLAAGHRGPLPCPWFAPSLRATGWLVSCEVR
jgi:SAM-dependent methyltransferase